MPIFGGTGHARGRPLVAGMARSYNLDEKLHCMNATVVSPCFDNETIPTPIPDIIAQHPDQNPKETPWPVHKPLR